MIPRSLELRNFMCYRADVPRLDFDGITIACLSGENGSGKSALLDSITWALWGEARLRSDDDLIALGETEMMVDLTFSLDSQDYRVLRKRSKGKRGQSQLEFQIRAETAWKVISGATLRETQQKIDQTLRMGFETFSNSAFLRQGRANEFTSKEPSKRKQVLADILGLNVYEQLEDASKGRAKEIDGRTKVVDGEIQAYRSQAEKRELFIEEVRLAEQRLGDIELLLAQARLADDAADARVRALEVRQPLRDERRRQLEERQIRRNELAIKVEKTNRAIVAARQILGEAEKIRAGAALLDAANADLSRMDGLRDQYDQLLNQRRGHEQELREARARIEQELARVEGELRSLQERAARRPKLDRDIRELMVRLEQLSPIAGELEQARRTRADLQERGRVANQLKFRKLDIQNIIEKRRDSLVASREELKRRVKQAAELFKDEARWRVDLEQAQRERAMLEAEQADLEQLRTTEAHSTEQLGALRAACDTIKSQGEQITKKIQLLTTADLASCPLCGGELGHDGMAHIQEEFQRERTELRLRFTQTKRDTETMDNQLREVKTLISTIGQRTAGLTELAGKIARLDRDLHTAEEARLRQNEDQRQLDDVQVQILKGDFEQGLRAELARVEAELMGTGGVELIETEMKRAERRIAELEKQLAEQAELKAQIQSRRDEIKQIDDNDPALHEQELRQRELTTTLQMEDYGHPQRLAIKALDSEVIALGYTPELHTSTRERIRELAHWAQELNRLEKAEVWLTENQPQAIRDEEELQRHDTEIAQAEEELRLIEAELRALEPAVRMRNETRVALRQIQTDQRVIERDLAQKQAHLKQAEEASVLLLEREADRKRLADRKGLFDELSQAFGKKGVQALLIETAIPEIEREANTLLSAMTDNQMHLRFETQGETKKGEVTETLNINISDGLGTRDYDAYSGGESFRVDFAIRVALAKLLARRAGARLETLIIDEGFGSQDARGRERLVEAITSIQRDFKQILVVTHIQELKDMFPVQIEVVKTADGSRWAIA